MFRSPNQHEKCSSEPDIAHLLELETESETKLADIPKTKRRRVAEPLNDSKLDQILSLITKQGARLCTLEGHIKDLKAQNNTIQSANKDIIKSIENVTDQLSQMQVKVDLLESKKQDMCLNLAKLEEKLDRLERCAVKTSIEIRQVPKKPKENKEYLHACLKSLSRSIGHPFEGVVIRDIFRLPSKTTDVNSTVVVEFVSTFNKINFLQCVKRKNQSSRLSTKDLGIEGESTPIFVSEHLSAKARHLYYRARDVAKSCQFAFCWTANGQVFLRKEESEPQVLIRSEAQLENIKNNFSQ